MKITFPCPECGRNHTVAAVNVGRKGRCTRCGSVMTVPEEADGAYSLVEPEPPPPRMPIASEILHDSEGTFAARPETLARRGSGKRSRGEKLLREAKQEAFDFLAILTASWKWWVGVPAGFAVVLVLIASFMPHGILIAACILATAGIVMILSGFLIGAYGAFHEDFLNGMLYVFIPFYTAYFIATNWDAMWRWAVLMFVGSVLILIAGKIALPTLEEMNKTEIGGTRAATSPGMELAARLFSPVIPYSGS